jgi:hypothetical protein
MTDPNEDPTSDPPGIPPPVDDTPAYCYRYIRGVHPGSAGLALPFQPAAVDPGPTLRMVGLILASQCARPSILSIVFLVVSLIIVAIVIAVIVAVAVVGASVALVNRCAELGGAAPQISGVIVNCPLR